MNTVRILSIFMLAMALFSGLGCSSTATRESTGEYIDDSVITARVKAAIFNTDTLRSAEINVETFKGVVQLSGFVNSRSDIRVAVGVASGVKGVKSIRNDMQVK